jgi:hypothetical protein
MQKSQGSGARGTLRRPPQVAFGPVPISGRFPGANFIFLRSSLVFHTVTLNLFKKFNKWVFNPI